jgi:hypothetical protein
MSVEANRHSDYRTTHQWSLSLAVIHALQENAEETKQEGTGFALQPTTSGDGARKSEVAIGPTVAVMFRPCRDTRGSRSLMVGDFCLSAVFFAVSDCIAILRMMRFLPHRR